MGQPSSISRRIQSCWEHYVKGEYEEALIDFFPALDKTAKKRRPKTKSTGGRIKGYLSDMEGVTTVLATGSFIVGNRINDFTLADAIYKFGRNSIAHEGELDARLTINDDGIFIVGGSWSLPSEYIPALAVSVMIAPENSNERIEMPGKYKVFHEVFALNELWGAESKVKNIIATSFGDPNLFD